MLVVVAVAKSAIAEPYYVPSGSMEPTLLVGDELLATKFPYGYSSASLPLSIAWPRTERILGALPVRGDVVVFRHPANRSQVWVKRVIGLPGDRVQMRDGRLWINGEPVGLKHDGSALTGEDEGLQLSATRYIETLPGGRTHPILKLEDTARSTTRRKSSCRRTICLSWATIATTRLTAAFPSRAAASDCFPSRT